MNADFARDSDMNAGFEMGFDKGRHMNSDLARDSDMNAGFEMDLTRADIWKRTSPRSWT